MNIQSYIELCKNKRIECMKKSTKMEFLHSAIVFNHKNFNKIINYGENKQRLTYIDNFQRPLRLRFFKIFLPLLVAVLALKPDVLITFLLRPIKVCFDINF